MKHQQLLQTIMGTEPIIRIVYMIQKFDRELAAINSGFPIGNIEQIISRPGAIGPSFLLNSRRVPHGIAARSRSPPHFWRRRHAWHSGKDLSSSR